MIYENTSRLYANNKFPFVCAHLSSHDNIDYHCHREIEIIMVSSGSINMLYNQKIYFLTAGSIFIVAPYMLHAMTAPSDGYSQYSFLFDLSIINSDSANYDTNESYYNLFRQIEPSSSNWPEDTKASMNALLMEMYHEFENKDFAYRIALRSLCMRFLLICLRNVPACSSQELDQKASRISIIIEYISTHLHATIREEDCAALLHIQREVFSRFFKKNMGITFQEYVKGARIEQAKFLLQSTADPVTSVCYAVGYNDISTFNKHFKALVGCTPTVYRKYFLPSRTSLSVYGRKELSGFGADEDLMY